MKTTIKSVTTVSGSAGSFSGKPKADVVLRVVGNAQTVEQVREYVERACGAYPELGAMLREAYDVLGAGYPDTQQQKALADRIGKVLIEWKAVRA